MALLSTWTASLRWATQRLYKGLMQRHGRRGEGMHDGSCVTLQVPGRASPCGRCFARGGSCAQCACAVPHLDPRSCAAVSAIVGDVVIQPAGRGAPRWQAGGEQRRHAFALDIAGSCLCCSCGTSPSFCVACVTDCVRYGLGCSLCVYCYFPNGRPALACDEAFAAMASLVCDVAAAALMTLHACPAWPRTATPPWQPRRMIRTPPAQAPLPATMLR